MESIPRVNVISVETIEACNHEVSAMVFVVFFSVLRDPHPTIVIQLWLLKFETRVISCYNNKKRVIILQILLLLSWLALMHHVTEYVPAKNWWIPPRRFQITLLWVGMGIMLSQTLRFFYYFHLKGCSTWRMWICTLGPKGNKTC